MIKLEKEQVESLQGLNFKKHEAFDKINEITISLNTQFNNWWQSVYKANNLNVKDTYIVEIVEGKPCLVKQGDVKEVVKVKK